MIIAVLSRVWRGELPYIESWIDYYLNLGFDKVILLRCDDEKFNFLKKFKDQIEFHDIPANSEKTLFDALVKFPINKKFDYLFHCDIDEYLILNKNIKEFIKETNKDYYFFRWYLNANPNFSTFLINNNLKNGVSFGHSGKVLFNTKKVESIKNEHEVKMKNATNWDGDYPYLLHCVFRGFEDLVIKGIFQGLKVENNKNLYIEQYKNPPKLFQNLALRYKIAYFQNKLKRIERNITLPKLKINLDFIDILKKEIKLDFTKPCRIFDKEYDIADLIKNYPNINFYEVNHYKNKIKLI